jgi:DNA-binding LacI/PurR family transcriptional regulator
LIPNAFVLNQSVMKAFENAGVPVVLIDRDIVGFPERSHHDLIGIDNFRAGYIMARHLLSLYGERIDFVVRPYSATTEIERVKGYQDALRHAGIEPSKKWVHYRDPRDKDYFAPLVRDGKARNFVCGNDWTAVDLIDTLEELGYPVPASTHVVGFDDVKYARFLKTPLTTYRQPSADIAGVAVQALLDRIRTPDLPPRHVTLAGSLEVRSSCGAHEVP